MDKLQSDDASDQHEGVMKPTVFALTCQTNAAYLNGDVMDNNTEVIKFVSDAMENNNDATNLDIDATKNNTGAPNNIDCDMDSKNIVICDKCERIVAEEYLSSANDPSLEVSANDQKNALNDQTKCNIFGTDGTNTQKTACCHDDKCKTADNNVTDIGETDSAQKCGKNKGADNTVTDKGHCGMKKCPNATESEGGAMKKFSDATEHDGGATENSNYVTDNENSVTSSDDMFCDCKSIMSSQRSSVKREKPHKKVAKSLSDSASICTFPTQSTLMDFCRICHCEGDAEIGPLIAPCYCRGSLRYVHQTCLQQWIKSSDSKHCELCGYQFIMDSKLMPLRKWKKLSMSTTERRKIMFSVMFHVIAITCVIWSLYVLIERTANEIKVGKLQWPFWTKLVVVAIGFTGGLVFMYVQCKVYVQLWKRLKAHNRVIYVKSNSPDGTDDSPTDDGDSIQSTNEPTSPQDNDAVIVEIRN